MSTSESPAAASDPRPSGSTGVRPRAWFGQQLSSAEATELALQIGLLAERGLVLHAGLRAVAAEQSRGRLRESLLLLASELEAGRPLPEALERLQGVVPASVQALLLAALKSGRFAEVVDQYITDQRNSQELLRRLRNMLMYPVALILACTLLLVGLETFVVSQFRAIYDDFAVALPPMTQAVLWLSQSIAYFLVGASLAIGAVVLLVLLGARRCARRRFAYRAPFIGPLWRFTVLARFARLCGLLVDHAVPLPDALHFAAAATGDPDLRRKVDAVVDQLLAGKQLAARLACEARLPAGLAQIIGWGEKHDALGASLGLAAEMYNAQAQGQVAFAAMVAPPLALMFTVFTVGLIIVSLMAPMIDLIGKLV